MLRAGYMSSSIWITGLLKIAKIYIV